MSAGDDPFGWRVAILCGLLWGVAVTLADSLTQPLTRLGAAQALFMLGLLWQWSWTGLVWSLGAKLFVRGRWAVLKALPLLPASLVIALVTQMISPIPLSSDGDTVNTPFVGNIPIADLAAYLLWTNMFYGGLYVIGYLTTLRAAIARGRLARFRLEQSKADLMLREARISAFRGQIQPAMLLSALAALRERYARDATEGALLFDRLIGFLRAAMPSVRSGLSSLAAELATVQTYATLRRSLETPGCIWRLDVPAKIPPVPFPALILLPALDGLGSMLPEDGFLSLRVEMRGDELVIELSADRPTTLPETIEKRLRGGLVLTFGTDARLSEGGDLPMHIRLRIQPVDDGGDAYPDRCSTGDSDDTHFPRDIGGHDPLAIRLGH